MAGLFVTPGEVTTITLNRPDVRNALNESVVGELTDVAASIGADASIRVVILRGAGPAFCAGADANWMARMAGYSHDENLRDARRATGMFHALDCLPVPVVCVVHGAALGGGVGLAAVSDIVIAADDAQFGLTETTLGLVPAMISPYLVRKIGLSAARALCLSGQRFAAAHARAIGLAHDVVPPAGLDAAVDTHTRQLLAAAPSAVAATKRLLRAVAGHTPDEVLQLTAEVIANQRVSPEGQEGLRAFLEKRRPAWAPSRAGKSQQ
jgi:methylglutaconyl-CoA hydratase